MKWAICDKFQDYLYGAKFEVHTDNNPMTYVMTSAKLDATGQRWAAELANYDFMIKYRSGQHNIDADALSRLPESSQTSIIQDSEKYTTISNDKVKAYCHSQFAHPMFISCLNFPLTAEEKLSSSLVHKSSEELFQEQLDDPTLDSFYYCFTRRY